MKAEDLHGRTLDLGSGRTEQLKDLPGLPADAEIIAVSKNIFHGSYPFIDALREKPGWDKKTVEADATALPFGDETFDRVLSVELWQLLTDKTGVALNETWRVLKGGGEIRIEPANPRDERKARSILGSLGAEIILEEFEPEIYEKYRPDHTEDHPKYRMIIRKPKK